MSRLGRQLSRGFKNFGRQLSSQGNIIGRQISNTDKDIQSVIPKIQKVSDGISKALSPIPVVGQAVQAGLGVANSAGGVLASGGTGIRNLTSGDFDSAQRNFQSAVQDGAQAVAGGALLLA